VERFADKLVLALTPLKRLVLDELRGEDSLSEFDLYKSVVSALMRAKFGEPSVEVLNENHYSVGYECTDDLGAESERGIVIDRDPHYGVVIDVYYTVKSVDEIKRMLGL
jgi:23S rRNA A2030 N6-methylase RlmJ